MILALSFKLIDYCISNEDENLVICKKRARLTDTMLRRETTIYRVIFDESSKYRKLNLG